MLRFMNFKVKLENFEKKKKKDLQEKENSKKKMRERERKGLKGKICVSE